jgi:hypothetical protein
VRPSHEVPQLPEHLGTLLPGGASDHAGDELARQGFGAARFEHPPRHQLTPVQDLRRVRSGLGVHEDQTRDTLRVPGREPHRHVAAHRQPTEDDPVQAEAVQEGGEVVDDVLE